MTKSNRGLAVMIMAVILFATIFMIPVPAASAGSAGSAAGSAAAVKPNAAGRYILSGTVVQEPVIECEDLDGNNIQLLYCMIEDCNGEVWGYAYEMDNLNDVPPMYQSVTLIMNCNGTPDDNFDDIIEDILWCNCENAAEED
jgi:hypothetical protein